jgi:sugar transferase (PEP-CTERM/EpsH1 system associated)
VNILFVLPRFPYPPLQGDRLRGYHHLRVLSRRHRITLVTPEPGARRQEALDAIRPFCQQVELVPAARWRSVLRLARAPWSSLPLQTLFFFDPLFRRKVAQLLRDTTFDLLHAQIVRMAPVIDALPSTPAVLDLVDALSLNMRRRAQQERGPLAWIAAWEARRVRRYEQVLVQRYDQLAVSSPVDRSYIGGYANIHVVPNGVDVAAIPYIQDDRPTNEIIFTGRMGYFPNAHAATYFATRVLPLVRRQVPGATFVIAGADPPARVRRLARLPGVSVTGYLARLQDRLARATVAVAPLQAGSGLQIKVLEAMACGTPVVATRYAVGGIAARHGEHLLVADDTPEGLAAQVVRLLRDPCERRRLAHNARQLVEERYTWDRSGALLEGLYSLASVTR